MAEYVFKLPDVGEGVAEAEIVEWLVAVGDVIEEDAPLVEVMTDKATVELPSPVAGRIGRLAADVGAVVAVGSELVRIEVDGDATPTVPAAEIAPPAEPPRAAPAAQPVAARSRVLAAPAVRRRATALGIELADLAGSGPDGRVVHEDLDTLITTRRPAESTSPGTSADEVEVVKVAGLRRNIAARMEEAHRIPHFTYVEEIDVTALERVRAELNDAGDERPKLTLLPFVMRAVVISVAEFPQMNARFRSSDGIIERHRAVHLGVATQTDKGLMVPVVRHTEALDLWACAGEVSRLAAAAREGTIKLHELSGSTITITSLGALGGIVTTPIINAPEVAIIGVNRIAARPVQRNGTWVARQVMNLSSSFDHRVIDGWDAAQFIQRVRQLLETPALLLALR